MSAKSVSPPLEGTTSIRSMESPGGTGSLDTSECHCWPATALDLGPALMTINSSGMPGLLTGVVMGVPRRCPNSACACISISWLRATTIPRSAASCFNAVTSSSLKLTSWVPFASSTPNDGLMLLYSIKRFRRCVRWVSIRPMNQCHWPLMGRLFFVRLSV